MDESVALTVSVNGRTVRRLVSARMNLVDFVRNELGLTGTHVGCEQGVCGACTIVLDGVVVRGCLTLAVQANGRGLETIEGASETGRLAMLQAAFFERNAAQCGFCTPGMLLTAAELLEASHSPSRAQIRTALAGNLCRCTGYEAIVDAIEATASVIAAGSHEDEE
jgi:aerobic-type carbon monoxide dehydrogenase small subunit (CoxS/CutS family)